MDQTKGFTRPSDSTEAELLRFQSELRAQNEELREAQGRLETSFHEYLQMFEESPIAMLIVSDEAWIERMNSATRRLLGLRHRGIKGGALVAFLESQQHDQLFAAFRSVRQKGAKVEVELRMPQPKQTRTVRCVIETFDAQSFIVALVDITEIREAERARLRAEGRHRRFFDASRDALIVFDARTDQIIEANPSAAALLSAREPASLVGRAMTEFVPVGQVGAWRSLVQGTSLDDTQATVQLTLQRTGQDVLTEVRLSIIDHQPTTLLASFRDVRDVKELLDDRRELQDRLRQVEKMDALGTLAGGVAHDMNNMLTAVRIGASSLVEDLPANTPGREDAESILMACTRFSKLVENLLGFARQQPHEDTAVVSEAVSEVLALVDSRIRRSRLKLSWEQRSDLRVCSPPSLVTQSVMNLVLNAVDELPPTPNSEIQIQTRSMHREDLKVPEDVEGNQFVEVAVTDNGPGMSDEVKERAFDPFFTTKPKGKGTGLGLAVVQRNTRQIGGWVEVDSALGEGTTVRLYYPRSLPRPERVEFAAPSDRATKVLLVEDEALVAKSVSRFLRRSGFQVSTAENGQVGVERFREDPPDIVLLDVVMPVMDGPSCARVLRKLNPRLPILFYSAHLRGHGLETLELDHQTDLLEKPFEFSELKTRLNRLLDGLRPKEGPLPEPALVEVR